MVEQYTKISRLDVIEQLRHLIDRALPTLGRRQEPFLPIETLLCYGLFFIFDPHHFGGRNIDQLPSIARRLAKVFRRSPSSILSKMLNLDGSRTNSARTEPILFATLVSQPSLFRGIYNMILGAAREVGISNEELPDFLDYLDGTLTGAANSNSSRVEPQLMLGQEELPPSDTELLVMEEEPANIAIVERDLGEQITEKLLVGRVRLTQHRFAKSVFRNWQRACVFCGFSPSTLRERSGLLFASHIKPWAHSTPSERMDIRNGLAACPIHDAAFDRGYITVLPDHRIVLSTLLKESIRNGDPRVQDYFSGMLRDRIMPLSGSLDPRPSYLIYHRDNIFRR